MRRRSEKPVVQAEAARALGSLARNYACRQSMFSEGILPRLADLLSSKVRLSPLHASLIIAHRLWCRTLGCSRRRCTRCT
jgi:hypothetical protein